MMPSRRDVLRSSCGLAASTLAAAWPKPVKAQSTAFKAVLFDAFPIFDATPLAALSREHFGERGEELTRLWRVRQFEYTWLRNAGQRYADFWKVTEDALVFATTALKLDLTQQKQQAMMNAYLCLRAWPDVKPALAALRQHGLRLGFLSNFTERMLRSSVASADLDGLFDVVLSTDRVRCFKPDPRAYQMGVDALGLRREQILFVAFAGWDASGARWFGYPTCWVNRLGSPPEALDVAANVVATDLSGLPALATS
jgi:2-haloacid dehalogenase